MLAKLQLIERRVDGSGRSSLKPGLVESARSAVPVLPPARLCEPLTEPAVRLSTQRALHGVCCQAWLAVAQGLGIVFPPVGTSRPSPHCRPLEVLRVAPPTLRT